MSGTSTSIVEECLPHFADSVKLSAKERVNLFWICRYAGHLEQILSTCNHFDLHFAINFFRQEVAQTDGPPPTPSEV